MLSALLSGVCCVGPFPGPIVESGFIGLGLVGRCRVVVWLVGVAGLLDYWV